MALRSALGWLAVHAVGLAALGCGLYWASLPGWSVWLLYAIALWLLAAFAWTWVVVRRTVPGRATLRPVDPWLLFPCATGLCILLVLTGLPMRIRFELSRPELEQAVTQFEAGQSVRSGWIGYIPVSEVFRWDSGSTVFRVEGVDNVWGGGCGYMHSETPPGPSSGAAGGLGDGWYGWCMPFMGD
jgi:hypothetical protein